MSDQDLGRSRDPPAASVQDPQSSEADVPAESQSRSHQTNSSSDIPLTNGHGHLPPVCTRSPLSTDTSNNSKAPSQSSSSLAPPSFEDPDAPDTNRTNHVEMARPLLLFPNGPQGDELPSRRQSFHHGTARQPAATLNLRRNSVGVVRPQWNWPLSFLQPRHSRSWTGGTGGDDDHGDSFADPEDPVARQTSVGLFLRQVEVLEAEEEWGQAMGISESSEEDEFIRPARRCGRFERRNSAVGLGTGPHSPNRQPMPQPNGVSPGHAREVAVVEVDREWGGAGGINSSDSEAGEPPRERERYGGRMMERRRVLADRIAAAPGEPVVDPPRAEEAPPAPGQSSLDDPDCCLRCRKLAGFIIFSILHMADFILRMCSLYVYWAGGWPLSVVCLVPLQVLGAVLSVYITFHDADVLLWLNKQTWRISRILVAAAAFWFFGCCQVIQVKRAWARQLHAAEVLNTGGDTDDRAATASSLPNLKGSERIMPVALVTGVPFLLVNWVWDSQCQYLSFYPMLVIISTNVVLIATVSLGLVEIDIAVSSYVLKRNFFLNPQRHLTCRQRLFPMVHMLFRASEVVLRLVVISGLLVLSEQVVNRELMGLPLLIDFCMGVTLLVNNSPNKERAQVHVLAGILLLVADLGHFVDQPNFAAPARRLTRRLTIVRFLTLVTLIAGRLIMAVARPDGKPEKFWNTAACEYLTFDDGRILIGFAVLYYLLRYSSPIARLGDDLHTAARNGDVDRVKKLLMPDHNGQVLDVNAAAKDAKGMTPLMYATEHGHLEVMVVLVKNGADVMSTTERTRDTCLHFAAKRGMVEAVRFLIDKGADITWPNTSGLVPGDMLPTSNRRGDKRELRQLLGLNPTQSAEVRSRLSSSNSDSEHRHTPRGSGRVSGEGDVTRWRRLSIRATRQAYCVKAVPTCGMQLRQLFPDVEKDDAPSPRVLQSVSALVVSRAAGGLARRVLARDDDAGSSVPLGALRRVRELGRGGFGRVIEVELPHQPSTNFFRTPGKPRRYALKLQLKQDQRQATSEVLALRRADHPFIVQLHRAFSFDKFFALLLELCPTDLNRVLCDRATENGRYEGLPAKDAARYMGQVMLALSHLHESNIVFRDVKPENILISFGDDAKLTDFGLAKVVTSAERMALCGTMGFQAPELFTSYHMHQGGVSSVFDTAGRSRVSHEDAVRGSSSFAVNYFKTDVYGFGVTLQIALLGEDGGRRKTIKHKGPMMLPLQQLSEKENAEMLEQLRQRGRLSGEAFELLVYRLLPHNPQNRAALMEVKNHDFFLKELNCTDLEECLIAERPASHIPSGISSILSNRTRASASP